MLTYATASMENQDYSKLFESEIAFAKKHIQEHPNRPSELPYFPCDLFETDDDTYEVIIDALDGLFYFELLASYGLYGNGPGWEGIVEQLLEIEKPHLLEQIEFDSEGNTFVAYLDSKESQLELAMFLHEVCNSETRLKGYLEKIDKDRIDA